jgi:phospholipase/carboxylesterase
MKTDCIEIEPDTTATASVIWLHGLGASGNDFVTLTPMLSLPKHLPVRFIFPHAPSRAVTINGGMVMPAWYDILGFDRCAKQDETGIRASSQIVRDLIAQERKRGIAFNRIILAGFSQGAAIVLHTGLRFSEKLAGIMALSGYLPLGDLAHLEKHPQSHETPIFLAHGEQDAVLDIDYANSTHHALTTLGFDVSYHTYPMQHSVCLEEIRDISRWMTAVL